MNNNSKVYSPYQMNKKASFGSIKSVTKPSGVNVPEFTEEFKLHYSSVKRTLTQTYQLQGTELQDTKVIAIQHNPKVNDSLRVVLSGVQYKIVDDSIDDSNNYLTYDLLTIKKVTKGGNS